MPHAKVVRVIPNAPPGAQAVSHSQLHGTCLWALTGMAVLGVAVVAVQQLRKNYAKRAT